MNVEVFENKKILIVDDNPRNVEVVANLLSGNNYDIEFAISGEEALVWIEKVAFDLILMDIMMPGIDGYETCKRIKEKEKYHDTPIIFLTAKTDTESLAKAFQTGGVDYVSKPFRSEELLSRVATHLELKQRREELKDLNTYLEKKVRERTRELQESNIKLSIALKDLEQLDNAKTDFLHMVSHELRTPLNGILGSIELLKTLTLPEDVLEYFEILDLSTKRLEKFSYQALNISQLQTHGTKSMHISEFPLTEFLNTYIKKYQETKKTSQGQLLFYPHETKKMIKADSDYLQKVLEIILENAFEHSVNNLPVKIFIEGTKDELLCIIQDEGRGFPQAMLEPSLLNFTPKVKHFDQKTGLALHYARMIMHHFNGELQLSNASEKGGAIVKLVFPAY